MFKVRYVPHFLAVVFFFLLTIGMTWPLILQLDTHVSPGQQPAMAVPYLNLWTLAWNHHWLQGQADSYWNANQFFPYQKTLAYSEPQLGTSLLTFPIVLFGGNTLLAYNLALFFFFFGAGMAVYALCWWILGLVKEAPQTDRCLASIIAGILYAFNPYMFREFGVLQLLATLFPPMCLLGLHFFLAEKYRFSLFLFFTGFLGCWYTCAYYGLFLSVFAASFIFLFWRGDLFHKQNILLGLAILAILIVCLLPLANGMHTAKISLSIDRSEDTVRELSAAFMEYLQPPSTNLLYKQILGLKTPGNSRFLGGVLICLASLGAITMLKSPILSERHSHDNKTHPMNRQKHPTWHRCGIAYLIMAFVAFILSLGMRFTPAYTNGLGIYKFVVWLSPYNLLYKFVPGFSSIRSPYRFSIFMALFLAILAGIGMLWVCRRFRSRWRWALILCLFLVTILELWPVPLRLVKVPSTLAELPRIYHNIRELPSDAVLIEFPLPISRSERELEGTARYIYFSSFHWRRLVNGYSGFAPKAQSEFTKMLTRSNPILALSALKAFGIQYILAHWNNMSNEEKTLLQTLKIEGNIKALFHEENQHTLYQINDIKDEGNTPWFPNIKRFTIYESKQQNRSVTLCFYYQMETNQSLLVTPWQNPIECEISWYNNSVKSSQMDRKPVLSKIVSYQASKLLHTESNAITIDVPAPAPGKYQVVVKHRFPSHSTTRTGVCEIYSHGFVQFREGL